jgi:Ca-activated chloride channel family protein
MPNLFTFGKLAGLIGLLSAVLVFGQSSKSDLPSSSTSTKTQSGPRIRVDVDLVLANVTVRDSSNRYVTGLSQEDFQLWEDKIEQQIQYFSAERVPVSVGIIFDTSGSMENKLAAARVAANTFLRMSDKDDEYFLVDFSDSPKLAQDFTEDIREMQSGLFTTQARGNTSLFDALYLGLEKVNHGNNSRKALLLITDGQDNHSRYSFSDVREYAKEHDVLIYTIGIIEGDGTQFADLQGRSVLQSFADMTGGIAFFPRQLEALPIICEQIGLALKNQYVLGYRSLNTAGDGKWRKIQVKIKRPKGMPRLHVRAKSGYYAPATAKVMK